MAKRMQKRGGKRVAARQRFVTRRTRVDECVRRAAVDEVRGCSGRIEALASSGRDPVAVQWRRVRVAV